jgi:hypothetical protein
MNVVGVSRGPSSSSLRRGIGGRERSDALNLELNFYSTPPNYELSLDEFEELALARLKVRIYAVIVQIIIMLY